MMTPTLLKKIVAIQVLCFVVLFLTRPCAADSIIYSANFSNGVPAGFSGVTNIESSQGYSGIGTGSNVFGAYFLRNASLSLPTTLTITNLPPHTNISLAFLFAAIDTWDGAFSAPGAPVPDYFNVTVDGQSIFSQTLCNYNPGGQQSYVPPTGVLLTPKPYPELGFQIRPGNPPDFGDAAYNLGLDPAFKNISHTASTLTISWVANGAGWQGGGDESWAIDNVSVSASLTPPTLSISPLNAGAALRWPIAFTGYLVESTTNLSRPTIWASITNVSTNLGAFYSVTVPVADSTRFFRLRYVKP